MAQYQTYLLLFPGTHQFGQLATCGDIEGDSFRIWLLDGDSTPKWVQCYPGGPLWCTTRHSILVYGPGDDDENTHYWRHIGPWTDDFKALVDSTLRRMRKTPKV